MQLLPHLSSINVCKEIFMNRPNLSVNQTLRQLGQSALYRSKEDSYEISEFIVLNFTRVTPHLMNEFANPLDHRCDPAGRDLQIDCLELVENDYLLELMIRAVK